MWWGVELAGCIIAAVQGREVVIQEATGVDDDEDEGVELSEDDELEHAEDLEEDVGFHNFARRPRSQRKRTLIDSPDPTTTEGAPHLPAKFLSDLLICFHCMPACPTDTRCPRCQADTMRCCMHQDVPIVVEMLFALRLRGTLPLVVTGCVLCCVSEEEYEEAAHSRQTRHRGLRRDTRGNGAISRGEGARGAGGNARLSSRLRHTVSRYSPEAGGAALSDRGARRHDREEQLQPAAPRAPTRWMLRSQEQPAGSGRAAAGASGGFAPDGGGERGAASAPGGGAPVLRLRVSTRLQGLETPPVSQLLRSQQQLPTEPSLAGATTVQLNFEPHASMDHLICIHMLQL